MRRFRRLSLSAAALLLLAACAAQPAAPGEPAAAERVELNVFAAASLKAGFEEIAAAFEAASPGARVTHSFAGSQQLAQQIAQGAPADVFASASQRQLESAGERVAPGSAHIFARNRLVVIYPPDNPAGIGALQDLARPGVKVVLAAPAVPVGQYALEFLGRASQLPRYTAAYSASVTANVVSYEESVRAVLGKVALGEADAGIVYATDVAGDGAEKVGQLAIPDELNVIASYPIAALADSPRADLARRYVAFVRGPEGQAILARHGFAPGDPPAPAS